MRLCVSLLAVAALAFAAETANPCKRQPFRGRCPSVNGEPPKRSQFVLRYYMRNGECVSYPFGHCANDETEPKLYRYKEECEDACISNAPANLGPAKVFEETYATPKASEQEVVAVANGVKNEVQEEPFSTVVSMIDAADPSTAPTPSTTLAAKTSVVTTTATASTEAPTTTTTSEATTTEVVTEEVKKTSPETTSTSTTTTTTPATTTTTTTSSTTTTTVPTTTTTKESMTSSTAPSTTTRAQAKVDAQATKSASGASATTTNSPRTECERRRAHASSSSIRGAFVPTCTSTGDFEKVQCEPSREQCFCVDSRGIELPNSRTRNGQRPDCYSIQTAQRSSGKECVGGVSRGPCHSTFSRWFYDESSQSCKQFEYSGCGGNGNNYDSKEACESRCAPPPMGLPKCEFGEPLKTKIGVPVNCAKTDCPSGYKCSVVQQSSVCCRESNKDLGLQTSDNRCHLPKERGPCDKYELRFYYNPDLHECKYFFWGGCDGNANNFEKADDCEVSCGIRKASAGTGSAPSEPATTARSHPNIRTTQGIRITPNMLSSDSGSDGSTTFATNPPTTTTRAVPTTTTRQTTTQTSTTTPRTRPVTTTTSQPPRSRTTTPAAESEEEDSSESAEPVIVAVPNQVLLGANRCHHPRDSGNCRGQFVRWHFDTERKVCDVFTYTGCQGNGNNFASREECLAICQKPASTAAPLPDFNNICNNDVDAGECNGVFQRFAFDTEAGSCREFTYGGCGGNGNNFATMAECRQRCLKTTPSESVGNACESDIDIGECEGVFHRFAFDKTFNDCRQFTYGGCGGNGNNFATMQECRNNCVNRVCPEPPACDVSRCQLVNDRAGCPFCSCPPVKQPLPPGTSQCPSVADCEEPCIKISNRKGCEECVCPSSTSRLSPPPTPELPSTVSVAASTRGARPPSHHVVQPPAPISVGPPAHSVAAPGPVQHAVPTFESTRSEPLELSRPTKPSPIPTRTSLPNLPSILSSQLEEKCMQPVEPGPCKNFADRWYFNSEDGTCHPFKYGGCAGNRNHFFTQKECEVHCERFLSGAAAPITATHVHDANTSELPPLANADVDVDRRLLRVHHQHAQHPARAHAAPRTRGQLQPNEVLAVLDEDKVRVPLDAKIPTHDDAQFRPIQPTVLRSELAPKADAPALPKQFSAPRRDGQYGMPVIDNYNPQANTNLAGLSPPVHPTYFTYNSQNQGQRRQFAVNQASFEGKPPVQLPRNVFPAFNANNGQATSTTAEPRQNFHQRQQQQQPNPLQRPEIWQPRPSQQAFQRSEVHLRPAQVNQDLQRPEVRLLPAQPRVVQNEQHGLQQNFVRPAPVATVAQPPQPQFQPRPNFAPPSTQTFGQPTQRFVEQRVFQARPVTQFIPQQPKQTAPLSTTTTTNARTTRFVPTTTTTPRRATTTAPWWQKTDAPWWLQNPQNSQRTANIPAGVQHPTENVGVRMDFGRNANLNFETTRKVPQLKIEKIVKTTQPFTTPTTTRRPTTISQRVVYTTTTTRRPTTTFRIAEDGSKIVPFAAFDNKKYVLYNGDFYGPTIPGVRVNTTTGQVIEGAPIDFRTFQSQQLQGFRTHPTPFSPRRTTDDLLEVQSRLTSTPNLRITDSDENFDGDVDTEFEEPTEPPRRVDGTRRSFAAGVTTRTAASSESYPPPNPPFRAEIRSDYGKNRMGVLPVAGLDVFASAHSPAPATIPIANAPQTTIVPRIPVAVAKSAHARIITGFVPTSSTSTTTTTTVAATTTTTTTTTTAAPTTTATTTTTAPSSTTTSVDDRSVTTLVNEINDMPSLPKEDFSREQVIKEIEEESAAAREVLFGKAPKADVPSQEFAEEFNGSGAELSEGESETTTIAVETSTLHLKKISILPKALSTKKPEPVPIPQLQEESEFAHASSEESSHEESSVSVSTSTTSLSSSSAAPPTSSSVASTTSAITEAATEATTTTTTAEVKVTTTTTPANTTVEESLFAFSSDEEAVDDENTEVIETVPEHRAAGSKLLQAPQPVQIEHKDNGIGRQPESVNIHAAAGTPTPATVPSTVRTSPTTRSIPTTTATSTSQKTTTRPTQPTPSGFEPKFDGRIACAMPPDAGTCFDYVPRWFFNSQTGQCEQFSFGSCGGNQNNFPDRNTCERKCMPHHVILSQVPDRCAQEKETGHGKGYNVKWYFNMKNLRCEQFVFEGLGGNANQFETLNECERLCTPSSAGIRQQPETTTQNKIIIDSLEEDDDENYSDDLVQTNSDVPPLPTIQPASVGNVEQRVELPPLVVETVATTTEKQILGPEPPANVEAALPPAAEPRPPAVNAAKTITAEDIRKSKTYKTESIVGRENFPTANDGQPIVGTSPKEEVNYQTGEVNPKASGIRNFPVGAEKINIDLADRVFEKKELNRMPACANGRQEMRYADGRPVMCLPGKNQCPDNSACYFNGLDFFCCPNEEDPYDKHVFGGYDGEETKQGYKVFGPLRIRRLMDEVPLRVRRQAQSVFSIDSVVAPLRFDAEKPHSVSRALRMKPKPEPRHNVNSLCIQQPIRGSCQEAHLRYYYDQGSDSCRLFEYTGCDGNANNFGSLDDCQRLCVLDVQRIGSAKVTTTTSAPEKVTPGQCPEGRAPLGGSSPVLCGNTTDSIGCPSSYYCRRGPPDVCCPGADPLIEQPEEIVTEERRGIVKNESNLPRGFNRKVFLSTPKHMCPDAADPLMLENGQPLSCGSGFDGVQMCPKGYYCAMDAERNSRLCCPMFGDAQRIASEEIFAHRISVAETTTTLAPSQFEAEDAEEEEDEEETEQEGSLAHLRMKADPNAKKEKLEQLALTSPQAADLAAEGSVAIDLGASEQPSEEPTTTTSKPVVDRSTCQIKPSEGRVCRDDEQPTRTNLQYFYSPRDRRCKLFFFRGCGGNENRFERKVDCEALCISG